MPRLPIVRAATNKAPSRALTRSSKLAAQKRKLDAVAELVQEVSTCVACLEPRPCMHLVLPCQLHTMCYYCVHAMVDSNTANTETSRISPSRDSPFCIDPERLSIKCSQCKQSVRIFVDSKLSALSFVSQANSRVLVHSLQVLGQLKPWRCQFDGCHVSSNDFMAARLHARICGKSKWTCRRRNHEGQGCGIKLDATEQIKHYSEECTTFYRCLLDPRLQNLTRIQFFSVNQCQDSVAMLLHNMQVVLERCAMTLPGAFRRLPLLSMVTQARMQLRLQAESQLRPT